jgi:putative hemolysin
MSPVDTKLRTTGNLPDQDAIPSLDEVHGRYRVHFARSSEELGAACRLRFEVFNLELGEGLETSYADGHDRDEFDAQCQHLIVTEAKTARVIGTYRMQVAGAARAGVGFYSGVEFDLSGLPSAVWLDTIELGRACMAKDHRNRTALFLLWRGLAAYLHWHEKQTFFGCSSLTSQNPLEGRATYLHLRREGHVHPELRVQPRPGYECVDDRGDVAGEAVRIPKLFSLYLRYGAKVLGPPALDRQFGTIDFLTMLDFSKLDQKKLDTIVK